MGTLIHTRDVALWDSVAREVNKLAGLVIYYFVLDRVQTQKDAVYGEPLNLAWNENIADVSESGIEVNAFGNEPEHALTTAEESKRRQWDGEIWIARADWERCVLSQLTEDSILHPQNGDVFLAWNKYWDVLDWDREGVMNDNRSVHTLWKIPFRRNTKFEPRRRVTGEG